MTTAAALFEDQPSGRSIAGDARQFLGTQSPPIRDCLHQPAAARCGLVQRAADCGGA
ncbi:MAG UNVERIFIED_CONTAM: hypothetical protein LVR18_35455 [Planctomycetaceae bacterium]